jgi:hypothetical protein
MFGIALSVSVHGKVGCRVHDVVANAPILVQNRTSGGQPMSEHPLPLSVNSTKPSCLAQRALAGALLMAETTTAPPIAGSASMTARTRFLIKTSWFNRRRRGIHGSPVLPARTSALPIGRRLRAAILAKFFVGPAVRGNTIPAPIKPRRTNEDQDDDDSGADACIRYEYRRRRTTGV